MDKNLPVQFEDEAKMTQRDQNLSTVYRFVQNGWPDKTKIELDVILKFYSLRSSLSIESGVLLYLKRTVIPPALQQKALSSLHASNQGMTRMKQLARGYVYWPGLDAENHAKRCIPCAQAAKSPGKTLLSSWPIPNAPFDRVHIDFCGPVYERYYLILVDALTKWPEVWPMTTITTTATIEKLLETTAQFGLIICLVSDNGPQLVSQQFMDFCQRNNIIQLTTAPYHPMSNGLAERFVDTFKRAISKHHKFYVKLIARDQWKYSIGRVTKNQFAYSS